MIVFKVIEGTFAAFGFICTLVLIKFITCTPKFPDDYYKTAVKKYNIGDVPGNQK